MVPVGEPGNDVLLEVGEDRLKRLALVGRRARQRPHQIARLRAREHRIAARLAEVRLDPRCNARELLREVIHAGEKMVMERA